MDFSFPTEQIELANNLQKWLQKNYDLPKRRQAVLQGNDIIWAALVELGVTHLLIDAEHGGLGGHSVDLFLIMQELGRGLATSVFWSTAVGAKALSLSKNQGLKDFLLPEIVKGNVKISLAFTELHARHDLEQITASLLAVNSSESEEVMALSGEKNVVLFGNHADYFLITAKLEGRIVLVLVSAQSNGLECHSYRTIDGIEAVELKMTSTLVPKTHILKTLWNDREFLERVSDFGCSLLCAEAVGLMELAKDSTLSHLKIRQQFGSPLSKFQALQHRMVDVLIALEKARSMAYLATAHSSHESHEVRSRSTAAAKALVGESGKYVGQQCVQLHGALGLTEECVVSHAFKRLTLIDLTLGDVDHHLERFSKITLPENNLRSSYAD